MRQIPAARRYRASRYSTCAAHPEARPQRGAAEEHDHRLQREWDGRERQRHAHLRGRGGQRGDEEQPTRRESRRPFRRRPTVVSNVPRISAGFP